MDAAFEEAKEAHDTIYQEENFEEYAGAKGLALKTSGFFLDVPPTGQLAGIQDLSEYVFNLEEGDLGRVFSDGTAHYVFRLVSLEPSYIPEFNEAAKKVRENYSQNKRKQFMPGEKADGDTRRPEGWGGYSEAREKQRP